MKSKNELLKEIDVKNVCLINLMVLFMVQKLILVIFC